MSFAHTVKTLITGAPVLLTGGVPRARAGRELLASNQPELSMGVALEVRSPAFGGGEPIPAIYSTDGEDISPPLQWSNVPETAESLVLLVEDPDAPLPKPFVHWIGFNIVPDLSEFRANVSRDEQVLMQQGKNSNLKTGWTGMAPPKGDTPHHYYFQLFALDAKLPLENGVGRTDLLKAMHGHVIGRGLLVGTFQR